MVAGIVTVRQDWAMRVFLATTAATLAAAAAGAAAGTGRVVRVEAPRRVEVFVPAGRFVMGVDEDAELAAVQQCELAYPAIAGTHPATGKPVGFCSVDYDAELFHTRRRSVYLDAYAIDRDEVSVADYRRCVAAGGCDLDPLISGDERYIHDDWPLVNVTWLEAGDYCRWRGARLPTEAEWERAARGDDVEATWPWGSVERPKDFNHGQPRAEAMREIERPQQTWLIPSPLLGDPDDSDGTVLIAPPGKYVWGEGPYGTRDQAGNVAEWTADAYLHEDNQKGYDNLAPTNPVREPKPGELVPARVVRGGSWRQPAFVAHANLRDPFNRIYNQNLRFSHIGFRCARTLREVQDAAGSTGSGRVGPGVGGRRVDHRVDR
jgi:formylglycine-generating enzyme required for sulfatase activity